MWNSRGSARAGARGHRCSSLARNLVHDLVPKCGLSWDTCFWIIHTCESFWLVTNYCFWFVQCQWRQSGSKGSLGDSKPSLETSMWKSLHMTNFISNCVTWLTLFGHWCSSCNCQHFVAIGSNDKKNSTTITWPFQTSLTNTSSSSDCELTSKELRRTSTLRKSGKHSQAIWSEALKSYTSHMTSVIQITPQRC